ncbi:hypothetical protein ACFS5L_02450 [Streptomyces phyllanthi]|uniref:hypothetical protein n=1 Tax=Streptomyces phyllanthi TaxID=1803180 RepID=UPI001D13D485|nr:hypothetical protein [Streptomyces phyllanthi]
MTKNQPAEGPQEFVYQVRLPLSKRTIDLVAGLIRRRRNQLGTRWRKLTPGAQAVVVLDVLRHDQRLADMAGGNHVSASCAAGCWKSSPCCPPAPRDWTGR